MLTPQNPLTDNDFVSLVLVASLRWRIHRLPCSLVAEELLVSSPKTSGLQKNTIVSAQLVLRT